MQRGCLQRRQAARERGAEQQRLAPLRQCRPYRSQLTLKARILNATNTQGRSVLDMEYVTKAVSP